MEFRSSHSFSGSCLSCFSVGTLTLNSRTRIRFTKAAVVSVSVVSGSVLPENSSLQRGVK